MNKQDYYQVLGVERTASERDIKMAFKRMARKYHPDIAEDKEEAEIKFKSINEAYAVLSDPEKRQVYDQFGHDGMSSAFGAGRSPFGGGAGFGDLGGIGDIFEMFFDMGGGGFTQRGRPGGQPRAARGRDLRKDVEISLEEAYRGVETDFEVESYQTCPVCNGRRVKPGAGFDTCQACQGTGMHRRAQNTMFGQFVTTSTCSQCNGEGQIPKELCEECDGQGRTINRQKLSVRIPPGIDEGMQLRLTEKGEAGQFGGPPGDLYVFVHVKEHEQFHREGKHLLMDLHIGFADAALGSEKEIETFDGKEKVKINAGIQSETIITLKEKGMPDLRGRKQGDLLVKVKVVTPTKLTEKQRQLLCEFAEEGPQFHCEKKGFFGKIIDALTGKK